MIIIEDAPNQLPLELEGVDDHIVATYHVHYDDIIGIASGYVQNCICEHERPADFNCFGECSRHLPATRPTTSIDDDAFFEEHSRTSITFPASPRTTFNLRSFVGCSSLTNVNFSISRFAVIRCDVCLVKITLPAALSRTDEGTIFQRLLRPRLFPRLLRPIAPSQIAPR